MDSRFELNRRRLTAKCQWLRAGKLRRKLLESHQVAWSLARSCCSSASGFARPGEKVDTRLQTGTGKSNIGRFLDSHQDPSPVLLRDTNARMQVACTMALSAHKSVIINPFGTGVIGSSKDEDNSVSGVLVHHGDIITKSILGLKLLDT